MSILLTPNEALEIQERLEQQLAAAQANNEQLLETLRKENFAADGWANSFYNALQHVRNLRDGITDFNSVIENLNECESSSQADWQAAGARHVLELQNDTTTLHAYAKRIVDEQNVELTAALSATVEQRDKMLAVLDTVSNELKHMAGFVGNVERILSAIDSVNSCAGISNDLLESDKYVHPKLLQFQVDVLRKQRDELLSIVVDMRKELFVSSRPSMNIQRRMDSVIARMKVKT